MVASAHPLVRLLLAHPELLAEHASAYGQMLVDEGLAVSAAWQRRTALRMLAGGALLAGVVLAGQTVLWWSVMPERLWPWMLGVPASPLLVAAWAWWNSTRAAQLRAEPWAGLRRQLLADLALIRSTAAAS